MWELSFWRATGERAISTTAQTALVLIGSDLTGYLSIDYGKVAIISAIAGGLAVLKALAASTSNGTPSLGNFEKLS